MRNFITMALLVPIILISASAKASTQSTAAPLGFEPELIIYTPDGNAAAIKLAPKLTDTIDECKEELIPIVAGLTIKGVRVNGACVPIPPAPPPQIVPQAHNPDKISPESFQMTTIG